MSAQFHVHWPPLGMALVLALVAFWLNQEARRPLPVDDPSFDLTPDFKIVNFDATTFGVDGKPRHNLIATHLSHIEPDDSTEMIAPRYRTFNPEYPVVITSKRALLLGASTVHFLGSVHVVRKNPGDAPLLMDTEHLVVHPDLDSMNTEKFVTLRQGKSITTAGGGLTADQTTKQIVLVGGVRGIYEAKKH
ncbi:MAG: LPS export ABC transporter periplasmic protein LptC [Betaproteobacteria bacterium]|nr:LPS export ABC transporter periplasmic protein LptC [Betaproteobacteria bacterium]